MRELIGATLCSGIGAPETAAARLGLPVRWAWCSEIDRAASHVHAVRFPGSVNLGDMTADDFAARALAIGLPDLIVAGTPCQDFSVAGLRAGLDGDRGNLTLQMVRILDEFSSAAHAMGRPGPCLLWENVPGVLSDKTNALGCLIGALAGDDEPIVPPEGRQWWGVSGGGIRYPKWPVQGSVVGPRRLIAWRIVDAQGFAPQRRERVFLVALEHDWGIDPERVLFESEAEALRNLGDAAGLAGASSGGGAGGLAALYRQVLPQWAGLRGDSAAGGEAGQEIAEDAQDGAGIGGVPGSPGIRTVGREHEISCQEVAPTLASRKSGGGGLGTDAEIVGGLIASPER